MSKGIALRNVTYVAKWGKNHPPGNISIKISKEVSQRHVKHYIVLSSKNSLGFEPKTFRSNLANLSMVIGKVAM